MAFLSSLWSAQEVPSRHRNNFFHLYLDIGWYGVLSGSALAFMAVFATRLGASSIEIGSLNAGPAIVNLLLTLPAGQWLQHRPISRSVFWTSVFHRFFYLTWAFLPFFLGPKGQVLALIGLVLLMTIPGTALAVGFNSLFGAAVPPEWRGHVVGMRNIVFSMVYIVTNLACGYLLDRLAFPWGYQVVFGIGFLGAAMSSVHLWYVRPENDSPKRPLSAIPLADYARPGMVHTPDSWLASAGLRFIAQLKTLKPRVDVLQGPFGRVTFLLFFFHLAQYLAVPLFPIYLVHNLNLTDQDISLGTSIFYVLVLIGSTQLARLSHRFGNQRLFALGIGMMSFYPILLSFSHGVPLYIVTSIWGGAAWSIVGGVTSNYILERVPDDERPSHMAWYNLALNGAVLLGSLIGPFLADEMGIVPALFFAAGVRFLSALSLWFFG